MKVYLVAIVVAFSLIVGTSNACPKNYREVSGTTCAGIANLRCPSKQRCHVEHGNMPDAAGVCCEKVCPRNYREVPGTTCAGIANLQCQRGQRCHIQHANMPDAAGVCCERARPPKNPCPSSHRIPTHKKCGGIAGLPCPRGQVCRRRIQDKDLFDGFGICCKRQPNNDCPDSHPIPTHTKCGGPTDRSCPSGQVCRGRVYDKKKFDFPGICCKGH